MTENMNKVLEAIKNEAPYPADLHDSDAHKAEKALEKAGKIYRDEWTNDYVAR